MTVLVKNALESTVFMDKLLEDLLLLSVPEDRIEKELLSVVPVVKSAVRKVESIAQDRNVAINVHENGSKTEISGNDVLLERAFMNILENAVQI